MDFKWDIVLKRTNVAFVFQLLNQSIEKSGRLADYKLDTYGQNNQNIDTEDEKLLLRGSFRFMSEWKKLLFLGSPMIDDLKKLINHGLCIRQGNHYHYLFTKITPGGQIFVCFDSEWMSTDAHF